MNSLGAEIPTAWLLIIPFVNIYWLYKYSEGVEKVTAGKQSTILAFILLWILGPIGSCIVQVDFNKVAAGGAPAVAASATQVAPVTEVSTTTAETVAAVDQTPPTNPTPPVV